MICLHILGCERIFWVSISGGNSSEKLRSFLGLYNLLLLHNPLSMKESDLNSKLFPFSSDYDR